MKNMPQLLWWQTSKPEDVSTYVNVDLQRGNSVFFVLRFESEKAPKWKHLTMVRRKGREQWRIRVQTIMKLNKNPQFFKKKKKVLSTVTVTCVGPTGMVFVNIQQVLPGRIRSDSANEQALRETAHKGKKKSQERKSSERQE